jgi:hypothetical protein
MKAFLMGSNMNEESILKRTLIMTGKLVGVFSIWVALVSVVVIVAAGRVAAALSGNAPDQGALVPSDAKSDGAGTRVKSSPANATGKPNG